MSRARRVQLNLLVGLLLLGALAELAAIAAVVPFLAILSGAEGPGPLGSLQGMLDRLGAGTRHERLLLVTAAFGTAVIAAGTLRIALAWTMQSFSFGLGHDLAVGIQTRLLYQPYSYHSATNSSDLVAAHEKIFSVIHGVVLPALNALTAAFTSIVIIAVLMYIDAVAAGIAATAVAAIYLTLTYFTRRQLEHQGSVASAAQAQRVRSVQESLGGIRDIIIDHSQQVHLDQFERTSRRFSRAEALTAFISSAPRYAVEAVGMTLIALLAVAVSSRSGGFSAALPILGALALSAQRLLPLLQQVYQGWAQVRAGGAAASELAALLALDLPPDRPKPRAITPLPFHDAIRLQGVGFRYPGRSEWALRSIDLTIERGSRIALVGRTGSGKSTLADLVMGLLDPTEGCIAVDGIRLEGEARPRWQAQLAHVPQAIFLADATIEQNIAFACAQEDVDAERVRWAAKLAQAEEFVQQLPDGYGTFVGESGVRLSGGQRQRIGIARALYKRARVLILDEATSALDSATEAAVLNGIISMDEDLTVIMIAHRATSIAHCQKVVHLERGRIAAHATGVEGPARKFG